MTKGTHPKGICDLRKLLHKAQVRLTQAGSLSIGYLRIIRHKLLTSRTNDPILRKYPIINDPACVSRTCALCKILRKSHIPFVIAPRLPL